MSGRDIIVIGASSGGIEALNRLVGGLPSDLAAAVFVVVHLPPYAKSILPDLLARAGPLPAAHATDGESIRHGHIYVAPPDRHLLIESGNIRLSAGPRENFARPAVDTLFRSAAQACGPRTIGVVLSGALSDGTAGLWEIKRQGGIAVVQDPADAAYPSMPDSAIHQVSVDFVLPAAQIPALLTRLVREPSTAGNDITAGARGEREEQATAMRSAESNDLAEEKPGEAEVNQDKAEQVAGQRDGDVTVFVCPECGGSLWQTNAGNLLRFRCHVGHVYSAEGLVAGYNEEIERALWHAIRTLRDNANLSRQIANDAQRQGDTASSTLYLGRAGTDDEQATIIERMVGLIARRNGHESP